MILNSAIHPTPKGVGFSHFFVSENRALGTDEIKRVEELKEKIENLNSNIRLLENDNFNLIHTMPEASAEERSLNKQILDLEVGKALDLKETRAVGLAMSSTKANGGNAYTTDLSGSAVGTFADYIIGSVTKTSGLFDAIKKINLLSATHQIPVSRERVGKFVAMQELEDYTRNTTKIEPIMLEPNKLGTAIGLSKELLEDYGYDIEGYILDEISDALAETLDEAIVTGITVGKKQIEGLESLDGGSDGSQYVSVDTDIDIDVFSKIYHSLPSKYRQNATWVISEQLAEILTNLKDNDNRPLLVPNYLISPFNSTYTLFGRPVIVNSFVCSDFDTAGGKAIYFGDLSRAFVCGIRNGLEITRSTEYGFIRDEIMIKAMMRFDIKKAQAEAMVVGVIGETANAD